jgi:hypothetical protein
MAFKLHDFLLVPFVVMLLAHVLFGPAMRIYSRFKKRDYKTVKDSVRATVANPK